jgi:hypothetical protein
MEMDKPNKARKNIIIFTGQSGLKMVDCLDRLKKELKEQNIQIFSIEKRMEEKEEKDLKDLLSYPPRELERIWSESFDEISSEMNPDTLTFLTFHSVYFHQGNRVFIFHLDLEKLRKLRGKIKLFITFIDDIYDLYERLTLPGEMFALSIERQSKKEGKSIFEAVRNLSTLLEWREIEISHSREIARFLSDSSLPLPFYVIPVKYPAFMVARLVEKEINDLKIFYLSHPIRLAREGGKSSLIGEVNDIIREISREPDVFLFYPTGIDERRIAQENNLYLPSLLQRWDLPFDTDEMIKAPQEPPHLKNPLNPLGEKIPESLKLSVSYSLESLLYKIERQITSRDFMFIEYSRNGVIGYRPDFSSKDILEEFEHNVELIRRRGEKGPSRRKSIIFTSRGDLGDWRRKRLHELLVESYEKINTQNLERLTLELLPMLKQVNVIMHEGFAEINLSDIMGIDVKEKLKNTLLPFLIEQRMKERPPETGVIRKENMALMRESHEDLLDKIIGEIELPKLLVTLSEAKEDSMCIAIEGVARTVEFLKRLLKTDIFKETTSQ